MTFSSVATSALLWAGIAQAICTSNLLIDNYDNSTEGILSSNTITFDDGTTSDFKAISAENKISFTPIDNLSYVFTRFPCFEASNGGYDALNISIKAPIDGASIKIELQASTSCSTSRYTEYFTTLTGLTTDMQTYSVPLNAFQGANLNAIQSIVYQEFTPGEWEIGASQFSCEGVTDNPSSLLMKMPSEQLPNPATEMLEQSPNNLLTEIQEQPEDRSRESQEPFENIPIQTQEQFQDLYTEAQEQLVDFPTPDFTN
ncbi:hypothetical protein K3495_g9906 [Podosphaera aphanis]|nr:hypothetical protein K3495_g9906 [Podosphaera aphanis]